MGRTGFAVTSTVYVSALFVTLISMPASHLQTGYISEGAWAKAEHGLAQDCLSAVNAECLHAGPRKHPVLPHER